MKKALTLSYGLLFAAITAGSLLYLLVDFRTYDVIPTVRIYGVFQLILTLALCFFLLPSKTRWWSLARSAVFGAVLWVLLLIQLIPAVLWIAFNGITVAEYPFEGGVMGSWVYGAYHLAIFAWGAVNFLRQTRGRPNAGQRAGA